jgi:hypothetical protein
MPEVRSRDGTSTTYEHINPLKVTVSHLNLVFRTASGQWSAALLLFHGAGNEALLAYLWTHALGVQNCSSVRRRMLVQR